MSTVTRALAIAVASQILIFAAVFMLMLTEDFSFIQLLFETISAFGTVGLTMGITAKLSAFGKCMIMFVMFCGLIGPLTLVFSLARPAKQKLNIRQKMYLQDKVSRISEIPFSLKEENNKPISATRNKIAMSAAIPPTIAAIPPVTVAPRL